MNAMWSAAEIVMACICLAVTLACTANELTVFGTVGPTEPAAPYLEILKAAPEDADETQGDPPSLGVGDLRQLLPIHSPDLTPGPVPTVVAPRPFVAPLFIFGSDPLSLRWVAARRAELKALGAVGLLVEVPDEASLSRVLEVVRDLPIIPASGSNLARNLELHHYPALVTQEGVRQ